MKNEGMKVVNSPSPRLMTFYRYHWGFLIGPKVEDKPKVPGMRYHVKNHPVQGWVYEENSLEDVQTTNNLLARIVVAKVEDERRVVEIFRMTPVVQNDPNWRCRTWVADALSRMAKDGKAVGTAQLVWSEIELLARKYVAKKAAAGRYVTAKDMTSPRPTWDMLDGREVVP